MVWSWRIHRNPLSLRFVHTERRRSHVFSVVLCDLCCRGYRPVTLIEVWFSFTRFFRRLKNRLAISILLFEENYIVFVQNNWCGLLVSFCVNINFSFCCFYFWQILSVWRRSKMTLYIGYVTINFFSKFNIKILGENLAFYDFNDISLN